MKQIIRNLLNQSKRSHLCGHFKICTDKNEINFNYDKIHFYYDDIIKVSDSPSSVLAKTSSLALHLDLASCAR